MKITFTLDQIKQFNRMSVEERSRVIASCDTMTQLNDDQIVGFQHDITASSLVREVHKGLVKRVESKRRRRQRSAEATAAPETVAKAVNEPAAEPAEQQITIDEASGRIAVWVRDNFHRYVNQVMRVIGMLKDSGLGRDMATAWQTITKLIYDTIKPLFSYAAEYMRLPHRQRRPCTITVPLAPQHP